MAHRAGTNHTTCDLASAQIGERESQRLAEILGVSTTQARSLLQQTGSVDAAVAMHATAPGPSSRQAPTNNRAQQLQRSLAEMGLGHLTTLQASQLLARSDQSVDQAVSLYLEDPSSRGEGVPWARARQQDGEVINLLSEDSTSENASAMEGNDTDDNANDSHGRNVQQAPHHAAPAPDHQQQVGLDAHGVSPLGPQLESNVGMFSSDDDDTSLGAGGYTDSELDFEFNARKQKEEAMKKAYLNLPAPPQRPNDGTMNDMRSTPSLTTAILAAACKQLGGADASRVPLEQLPLAHHRLENGRLYVEDPSVLTSKAVAPPNPPRFPLHLGSVLLPIGGLRREALAGALAKGVTNGDDVTWTLPGLGQSKPFAHDYFVPSEAWREHARTDTPSDLPILQLKSFPSRTNLRFVAAHPFAVQLALGSRSLDLQLEPKDDCLPFVTVGGEIGTWPAKCVAVIGCLELRGLLTVRYTLQYTPGEVAARTAPSAIAAAPARHRGRGSIAATGRTSGKTPQPTSRSRDKRKGKAPVEADAGDDRSQQQQQQPPCSSSTATAPIAVRAEISLTPAGYDALFFDDATTGGDLAEVVESKATRKSSSDANNWRQFGESLSVLIACILQHGEGLRIGPDSDGIFNFMDTPHEEMHTEFQAPSANLPSKFDVNALLTSVAPHSNPTAHHPHDRVAPSATTTGGAGPSNAAALDSPLGNNNKHPLVLATATPPSGLVSSPKKYQLQGLQWMLDREVRGDAVGRGHALLHPAWTQLVTPDGYLLYVHRLRPHVLSSFFHLAPPVGTCGGCIADEMGLGKSLEALMLVASNKPPRGWALSSLVNVSVNRENPAPIKTTLLVAPATLLNQWEAEVQTHLVPGTLTWGRVLSASEAATWLSTAHVQTSRGSSRDAHHQRAGKGAAAAAASAPLATRRSVRSKRATKHYSGQEGAAMQSNDAAPLTITSANPHEFPVVPVYCRTSDQNHVVHIHQLDLALCSYELLRDQLSSETSTRPAPLHQFGYWRVCLDEAQLIANTNSVAAIMASSLWRRHAWVVTGTPITSRLDEVRGLLEFLALEPFHYSHVWNPLVKRECDRYSAQGLLAMRALLRGVLLRRSKADVEAELDLLPCVQEDVSVVLSSVERAVYERARREFLTAVSHAQSARAARQRRPRAGGTQQEPASGRGAATSGRVLTTLTALRQSTCHPQVVRSHDAMMGTNERLSMNAIMRRLLAQQLQEWESAARRVLDARAIALAVEAAQRGEDLEALSPLLEEVRFHARVALVEDFVSVLEIANGGRHGGRYGTEGEREGEGVNELQMRQGTMDIQKLEVLEAAQEERHAMENAELAGRVQEWEERFEAEVAALEAAKQDPEAKAALMQDAKGKNMAGGDRKTAKRKRKRHPKHAEDEEDKSDSDTMDDLDENENENDDMDDNDDEDDSQGGVHVCHESTVKSKKARKAPRQKKRRGAAAGPKCDIVAMVQRALGRRPQLLEAVAEARRDARMRWRSWRRLELSSLELLAHVLKEEAASTARRLKKKARSKNASNPALGKRSASTAGNGPLGGSGSGGGHAGHAGPSDATNERDPDVNPAELALTRTQEAITQLRLELGLLIPESAGGGSGSVDIAAIRRSRRQAGIDADDDAEVDLDPVEVAAQLENAVIPVRAVKEMLAKRDPQHSARAAVAQARNEAAEAWHRVRYALKTLQESGCGNLHADTVNADAGTSNGVQQDQRDLSSCPICFDELMTERTITRCNHHFCNYCIREVLEKNGGAGICPICRQPLTESDLFDALSESEAQAMERAKEASVGDYGAKISALLVALARLRAANPDAKAVVFSSWGRLLHLVHEALTANGVDCAVMHGGGPERRQAELDRFLNDPDCGVLTVLMSTSGGAAGLTLTAATAGFILEPAINPGLERQAAARIYRLGQTRSTKIFRLLAEDTVDGAVVDQQRWKMERGEAGLAAEDVDHGTLEALAEKLKV